MLYYLLYVLLCVELVRRRGLSEVGVSINVTSEYDLSETIKVSLLTSVGPNSPPIHVHLRRGGGANNAYSFLTFIVDCVSSGLLVRGDVVVLDNASIHKSVDILFPLFLLMNVAGITLWFLPVYSPELNPCEFVFAQCKKYLRYHRRMHYPFWYEIVRGFANTTPQQVMACYIKSIFNP
jgi:hypothetical protein